MDTSMQSKRGHKVKEVRSFFIIFLQHIESDCEVKVV